MKSIRWIWPISWFLRVRELEAKCEALERKNRELDAALRAAAIQQTAMDVAYLTSVNAVAAMITKRVGCVNFSHRTKGF